jgi:Fe-S cluster biogenesis protein NfuA
MPAFDSTGELKDRVARVVRDEVAPALEMDGAAIEVLDVSDGVVRVRLAGGCTGCPTTIYALMMGIEEELRRRVPEVEYLEIAP